MAGGSSTTEPTLYGGVLGGVKRIATSIFGGGSGSGGGGEGPETAEAARDARFYLGLSSVLRRTEHKAAVTIQNHWRVGERRGLGGMGYLPPMPPSVPPYRLPTTMTGHTSHRLLREVRNQAAHYIDATLSRSLLVKQLKLELSALMEKGRVYTPPGTSAQLVMWRLRFFFCTDTGLCYQKVASTMRPYGVKRLVPWGAIAKVEALLDDSNMHPCTYTHVHPSCVWHVHCMYTHRWRPSSTTPSTLRPAAARSTTSSRRASTTRPRPRGRGRRASASSRSCWARR